MHQNPEFLIFLQTLAVEILYLEVEVLLGSRVVAGNQLEGHQEDHQNRVAGLQSQAGDHQEHLDLLFLQILAVALLLGNLLEGIQILLAAVDRQYPQLDHPSLLAGLALPASIFLLLLAELLQYHLVQTGPVVPMGRTGEDLRRYS